MQGSLDYRKISIKDPKSLFKERLILSQIERNQAIRYKELSVLGIIAQQDEKAVVPEFSKTSRELSSIYRLLFPWKRDSMENAAANKLKEYRDLLKDA